MLKYALFDYVPRRALHRASFNQQEICRRILDFKDGRTYAKRWAAAEIGRALAAARLSEVVVVCVPASCQHTYVRRYKKFSKMLRTARRHARPSRTSTLAALRRRTAVGEERTGALHAYRTALTAAQ